MNPQWSPGSISVAAAVLGAGGAVGAGALAGGWWWIAAAIGAVSAAGAAVDRQLGHPQVLVALVLVAGLVSTDRQWYVPVLAASTIGAIELLAAADRTSLVRPRVPDVGRAIGAAAATAVLAGAVMVVGAASTGVPAAGAVIAALAAVGGLRVLAR